MSEPTSKREQAVAWFKTNGVQSTLEACAVAVGCSIGTARLARAELKATGVLPANFAPQDSRRRDALTVEHDTRDLPPATTSDASPPAPSVDPADALAESILDRVLAGSVQVMTPQQELMFLSEEARLAKPGSPHRIAALKAVGAARLRVGTQSELGPGVPQSRSAMVFRATNVLRACGRAMALEVWQAAFNEDIDHAQASEEREGPEGDARVQGGHAARAGWNEGDEAQASDRDRAVGTASSEPGE